MLEKGGSAASLTILNTFFKLNLHETNIVRAGFPA